MELGRTSSKKRRKGMVLPLVITIAVVLAILGIGFIQLGFGSRLVAAVTMSAISARTAADAGIRDALYEMNQRFVLGVGWDGTLPPDVVGRPLSNSVATYSYHVDYYPDDPLTPELADAYWQVSSTGTSGRETRLVFARLGLRNLFDYGLIVTDTIDLMQDTLIDGYDSGLGPYGGANSGGNVRIGSTSIEPRSIVLRNNVRVTGDVLAGIGADLDEAIVLLGTPGPSIGGYYNLPETWEFQPIPITVPPGVPSSGNINSSSPWDATQSIRIGTPGILTQVRYNNIDVPNSSSLIFIGPVELHVLGDLTLNNSATIFVGDPMDPTTIGSSSLTVYLDGDLSGGNSNGINNLSRRARNFGIFGTGPAGILQRWEIKNEGDFYGTYYAPNAQIIIKAKGDIYGSVSGRSFVLMTDPGEVYGLHYDADLADAHEYDSGFGIDRWWETMGP